MKRLSTLFLLLMLVACESRIAAAQDSFADSLKKILAVAKEDTSKVNVLNALSRLNRNSNAGQSIIYAKAALKLAVTLHHNKGAGYARINIGTALSNQGKYAEALEQLNIGLAISQKEGADRNAALAYNNMGNIYANKANYAEALKNYFAALKIRDKLGEKREVAYSYDNIGNIFYQQNNYTESLRYHFTALNVLEELNDQSGISAACNNIADTYIKLKKYDDAIKMCSRSVKIEEERDDKPGLADSYSIIGLAHLGQGNHLTAMNNFLKALNIRNAIDDIQGMESSYLQLGDTHVKLKEFSVAGRCYHESLLLSRKYGNKFNAEQSYYSLAALDSSLGNFSQAFENYKMYILYRDSITNAENTRNSIEAELTYQFDKKAELIKAQQEKKFALDGEEKKRGSIIRNIFIVAFVVILALLLLIAGGYIKLKKANLAIMRHKSALEEQNKELESFTYSVSHDLRAPLRIISGYTDILLNEYSDKLDDEGKRVSHVIITYAEKMGELIDDLLNFARLGRIELLKQNIDMNVLVPAIAKELKAKFNSNAEFIITELLPAYGDHNLISHVWQNLISNALKFSSQKENALIEISSLQQNDEVVYLIKDNGIGFDMKYSDKLFKIFQRLIKPDEFKGTGVGLAVAHRIITRHEGRIRAESEPGNGATFFFSLPIREI